MKKLTVAVAVLATMTAQSAIRVNPFGSSGATNKVWVVSDLNSNPQVITGVNTDSSIPANDDPEKGAVSVGQVASARPADRFSFAVTGAYGWSTAEAKEAVAGPAGSFKNYLDGLVTQGVRVKAQSTGDLGIDSGDVSRSDDEVSNSFDPKEVMLVTFDTSGLSEASTLTLDGVIFSIATSGDYADVLLYNPGQGTVRRVFGWNVSNPERIVFSQLPIEHGDVLIIATGDSQQPGEKWRVESFLFDVKTTERFTVGWLAPQVSGFSYFDIDAGRIPALCCISRGAPGIASLS